MSIATTDRPEQHAGAKPERDAKGRFARGNSGGPGNPFGRRLADLRTILLRSATEENVERLANMLMEKAFAGDLAAAKLLLLYWIGKPKEVAEPDRVDVDEWELARERVVRADVAEETFAAMPITVGLASLPALAEVHERQFADMMLHPENYRQEPDDEPTAEELAEDAEMIREMRASREAEAAPLPGAAAGATTPRPSAARQPSDRATGAAFTAHPQAADPFAPVPANDAAIGPPSPNGSAGRTSRLVPNAAERPRGTRQRVG